VDPATELTPTPPPQRGELDPLDRRLTAGLLALLLGFIVAIATWTVIWPIYRDANAPQAEAVATAEWPTTEVILWSLLVLALWIALWVGFFFWALSRRR
jgi:hypothetical protein